MNKIIWRSDVFKLSENTPLEVEVGTGAGMHFAHHAAKHKDRCLVGLELKYKPLIQSKIFVNQGIQINYIKLVK